MTRRAVTKKRSRDSVATDVAFERLKLALKASNTGTFIWYVKSDELFWDENLRDIFGVKETESIDHFADFIKRVDPADREALECGINDYILKGGEFQVEFRILHGGGEVRWTRDIGQVLTNDAGEAVIVTGACRDVTDEKTLEQALGRATEEALAASRFKSEFIQNLSHEMRTPMAAILGFLDLALNELPASEKDRHQWIKIAFENAQNLNQLIERLLDFRSLEYKYFKSVSHKFRVDELVKSAFEKAAREAEKKGLTFHVDTWSPLPTVIDGDSYRIRQILEEVAVNAVKFTKAGKVHVKLGWLSHGGTLFGPRDLIGFIEDTGVGISDQHKNHLFRRFVQEDGSLTRDYRGGGLGLAFARELAQVMGGNIWLKRSKVGEGSVFQWSLPVRGASHEVVDGRLESLLNREGSPHGSSALG